VKVLVVGSVPPPAAGHRQALLHEALWLRQEGHDVEIVSLDPRSAAHRYLAAPGVPAAVEVGLLARGADAVVLQLEPGLPVRHRAGRAERTAALMVLAAGLGSAKSLTVRLQHPDDLPGGTGGRAAATLWKVADRIEVGDEAMRRDLAGLLGPLGDRVRVAAASEAEEPRLATVLLAGGWGEGADATAAHIQAVVRARAAAERESLGKRGRLPVAGGGLGPRVPQWQWLPAPGAGVPDLGPLRTATAGQGRGAGRSRPRLPSARRAAASILAAAERRAFTRPVAHFARLALVELRGAPRPGTRQ